MIDLLLLSAPGAGEWLRVMTLQGGYNTNSVIVGAVMLGIAAGAIGVFALLRGRALMGDALSHATLPGVGVAFLAGTWLGWDPRSLPLLLCGAALSGVLGVLAVLFIVRQTRLREDAAIGIVLSVFFGAGAIVMQAIVRMDIGNRGGLQRFIYGQTAAMQGHDALVLSGVALLVLLVSLAFLKEFRLVCFNAEYAASQGWPVIVIDIVMMTFVVLVTVIGLQTVGLILVVALIIIPAAAARFWTDRLFVMLITAAGLGGLSGYLGATVSALYSDLPAGAVIVLAAGAVFIASMFLAPARGVLASAWRHVRVRDLTNRQHLLRHLFEREEIEGEGTPVTRVRLARERAWRGRGLHRALRQLARAGTITLGAAPDHAIALTTAGRVEAARVTRNHRLWEEYLVRHADVAPSHVDWSADQVEHVLSEPLVRELEAALRAQGIDVPAAPGAMEGATA
ncbi:MAG: metal ABC transporter permease [Phycisphaerales bacterium]|nr:metal ABC transporter permease [Phycisphaerales bacterium]